MNTNESKNNLRIGIFLILTFLQMILFSLLYNRSRNDAMLSLLMITPAISVIITRFVTKEGWRDLYLKPKLKTNWKIYLFSWIGIIFTAFFGSLVYFFIFNDTFNPLDSKFATSYNITNNCNYLQQFFIVVPLAIFINPLFGILFCFGEEFAWRGYLLPHLERKYGKQIASLIVSLIWGIWHAPVIWMGFNYNQEKSIVAVLAQIVLCLSLGIILSFIFFQSKSIWVPSLAHASINAIDKFTPNFLFVSSKQSINLLVGPNLTGFIGGVGLSILAVFLLFKMKSDSDRLYL